MAIELDIPLVRQLIETRFGSVDAFAVEWEHRVETRKQRSGGARDRATIYRWLKQGIPSKRDDLFGFAAALDVDPFALLRLDSRFVERNFARERLLFQLGSTARSKLHPFWEVFIPSPAWPNEELPSNFFGRGWSKFHFDHEATEIANVFAGVSIQPETCKDQISPRVFMFAYRRAEAVDMLWRPYGVVIHRYDSTRLLSENGAYVEHRTPYSTLDFLVETYFGRGPAQFQIASLHEFSASVTIPSESSLAVRFPA